MASGQTPPPDPRVGLAPGYFPWSEASSNLQLLDNDPRVAPFDAPPNNFGFVNSDLAFSGTNAIVGSFHGFQVYDLTDPADPVLRSSFVCPGGQGDVSVYGNLLFMSVEETRGRIDCGTQGAPGPVNLERFRGVRIFDITDIDNPVPVTMVQTCRGSHTHTIVSEPGRPGQHLDLQLRHCRCAVADGARRLRERRPDAGSGDDGQPDAVADRRHPRPARHPGGGQDRQPAADLHRPGDRCVQRPAEHAAGHRAAPVRDWVLRSRRRTPTRATTSPPTPSSASPPGRARATASCSTSPTR